MNSRLFIISWLESTWSYVIRQFLFTLNTFLSDSYCLFFIYKCIWTRLTIELPLLTGGITLHLNMRNLIRSNLTCICLIQITTSLIAMDVCMSVHFSLWKTYTYLQSKEIWFSFPDTFITYIPIVLYSW